MKKIVWITGNHMLIDTPSKTFNQQVGAISVGNVFDDVMRGGYIRSWWDDGTGLMDYPEHKRAPGVLFKFDMDGFANVPQYIYKAMERLCSDKEKYPKGVIFYQFHHHYQQRVRGNWGHSFRGARLVHGYLATTTDFHYILRWVTGPHYFQSLGVLLECEKYLTEEGE